MPITASYSSATRKLNALGDALSNNIIFTRDAAGTLFINGGAVPITGGPATVANTDLIEAFGLDLNDVIILDQLNGTLPAANLSGGNGNDILTGGSNGDILNGDAGVDTLQGQAGIDQLFGGADGDTMAGGDGDDTMNGGAGNDRMIWNSGDDNDVMEGGADSDIAEVNGSNGDETFSIAPDPGDPTRVDFARTSGVAFTIDIGTTENLVLNAGGGNDTLVTAGDLSVSSRSPSTAERATTICKAATAPTCCSAATATTSSTAIRAPTRPSSAPATTSSNGIRATAAT